MPQSGGTWAMYMLSLIVAKLYDLQPPVHIQDRSIVGRPVPAQIPRIIDTTLLPHYLLRTRTLFRFLDFPRHLIVVRHLRDSLVSHYEKRKGIYQVDFSTYLRGDLRRKMFRNDIWTRILYMNGWGVVAERHPQQVAVLRYEDLKADTHGQLARICDHFDIEGVTPALLDEVVANSTKSAMAEREDPRFHVVRMDPRPADEWYSDEDRRFVAEVCRRNLKYTFGYQYW